MLKVYLLNYTPIPEEVVNKAARLCYYKGDIEDLLGESNVNLIGKLVEMNHLTPLEHVSFTFGIEGISRACSHQLVRHRIASYSQQSQRYVSMNDFKYIIPPKIQNNSDALEIYNQIIHCIKKAYNKLYDILGEEAKEDIRYLLPNATETKIVVTMNARSLLNFFNLRLCNRAQWEIRSLAKKMLELCMEVAPNIFKYAGPDCKILGKCRQGKYSCKENDNEKSNS